MAIDNISILKSDPNDLGENFLGLNIKIFYFLVSFIKATTTDLSTATTSITDGSRTSTIQISSARPVFYCNFDDLTNQCGETQIINKLNLDIRESYYGTNFSYVTDLTSSIF